MVPNILSALRIIGTACLLFIKPVSAVFFIVYTLCGISDVLDGYIARRMNQESRLGAKLDSIADILFYAVILIKLFPVLWAFVPAWLWYVAGAVVMLRLISYSVAACKYRCFASLHTYMNKLTGAAVFGIMYMLYTPWTVVYCVAVCGIALLASAEELLIHARSDSYNEDTKTILKRRVSN